ncbi:protein FIP1 isoform X1 [Lactuca sativa]|uniref:protein FIP1 isoform X1 n=1 Tax=Lactuca sativa TaxID=4236 RepID=UPI0022B06B3A|nr:protein FIP1 isoform X1 [Lactuca sativa]
MSTDRYAASNLASPDDNYLFLDASNEAPSYGDRKCTSIAGSILYCILLASYAILGVGAPWVFQSEKYLTLQILCTCDVTLLIITGIFQQYMVYQVQKIRLQGYYIFSQKLKHVVRMPFASFSYGTCAMLLIMVWEPYLRILSIPLMLRIIMLVEAIFAGSFMGVYIGHVHQYNTLESQPDVVKSLHSPLQPSNSLEGLRFHDGGGYLSDQQMALLQYQRENLNFLSEEILRLQECLSKYEKSGDGMTPQVDLAHLLAARDQELRTLSAEMNQLQSELRLARSLVAEKEAEIQSARNTNNQYMEENERLRGILAEWSTRAAKLERALELERMSKLELQKKMTSFKTLQNMGHPLR